MTRRPRYHYDGESRLDVARTTYKVVSRYAMAAGEIDEPERREVLGWTDPEAIEDQVKRRAETAETQTLGNGRVVMEDLHDLCLDDDYARMKRDDQAAAFEPDGPRADLCAVCGAPRGYTP